MVTRRNLEFLQFSNYYQRVELEHGGSVTNMATLSSLEHCFNISPLFSVSERLVAPAPDKFVGDWKTLGSIELFLYLVSTLENFSL